MKQILIVVLLILGYLSYSQESYFVEGKDYCGYVFSKEDSLGGFPPEIIVGNVPIGSRRYTLTEKNIIRTEAILKKSINTEYVKKYVNSWESAWNTRFLLDKSTLKKYYRQYIGYLTPNNEEIVYICLIAKGFVSNIKKLSDGLIEVSDGGYSYWTITINLKTRKVFDMVVNGES